MQEGSRRDPASGSGGRIILSLLLGLLALSGGHNAYAQASSAEAGKALYPAAVDVVRLPDGYRYVDRDGMTLYVLERQVTRYRVGDPLTYCLVPECAAEFRPLKASADALPAGDWKPADTPLGRQWTYRSDPVFTSLLDKSPGSTLGEGRQDAFFTIPFVPPQPAFVAPPLVSLGYREGNWYFTSPGGKPLYAHEGKVQCEASCGEPFLAGLVAHPVGEWSIIARDDGLQWAYRKKPVFIAQSSDSAPDGDGAELLSVAAEWHGVRRLAGRR